MNSGGAKRRAAGGGLVIVIAGAVIAAALLSSSAGASTPGPEPNLAGPIMAPRPFPRGYGMPIKASDTWLLLYMVHSAVSQQRIVYITYDIDFIPKAKGDALGIKPVYPVWLDVRPSGYPVFNVERGYGQNGTCTW